MKRISYLFLAALLMSSCTGHRLNFDKGIIPPLPVNFEGVNSIYDDYNSDLQISWSERTFTLIFSSDRYSFGSDFDLVSYGGYVFFDLTDGYFRFDEISQTLSLLETVNTENNEFGPYFTKDLPFYWPWKKSGEERRLFYSNDAAGNLDIRCCRYDIDNGGFTASGDPFTLDALNTEHDEGYLSFHQGETLNRETVCFMSDRDGTFDIWSATGEEGKLINESAAVTVAPIPQLNSFADDKCPYICGNTMVFASDRPGGFGGFDLWYSVWSAGGWSAPVNMGEDINTPYDEYRPVIVSMAEAFLNDLMIFSSNRPGGKGGFDLYYTGVPRW